MTAKDGAETPTTNRRQRRRMLRAAVADNMVKPRDPRVQPPRASTSSTLPTRLSRGRLMVATAVALGAVAFAAGALVLRREGGTVAASAQSPPVLGAEASSLADTMTATLVPAASAATFEAPAAIDRSVFPLAVRRVVVDAGHGGADDGASNRDLAEKDITFDIADRLRKRLEANDFEVLMTRESDLSLSLRERVQMANANHADLFVSVHVNWFDGQSIPGIETYYLGATEDPELMALAQRENRESGYSLGDLRQLLDGVYADFRQDESRRLAGQIQRSLYRSLLPVSPQLRDRGVKTAPFVVLVATEMPAILAEVSCLSDLQEAERLKRPRYRDHIAEALFNGIQAYARDINQTIEKGS
jgi:N-acetylmuramoyl-L-alanine amidase